MQVLGAGGRGLVWILAHSASTAWCVGALENHRFHVSTAGRPSRAERPALFVVCGDDGLPPSALPLCRAIRTEHPAVSLIAVVRTGVRGRRQLPTLATHGVDDVVFAGEAGERERFRSIVRACTRHQLDTPTLEAMLEERHGRGRVIESWILRRGFRPVRTEEIAAHFGVHRRTILRLVHTRDGRPLRDLIALARALHVATELDRRRTDLETIARDLSFRSASAVRMLLRRMLRISPTELRDQGAVQTLLVSHRVRRVPNPTGPGNSDRLG